VSAPRRLWLRFRRVEPQRRPAYREAVAEAGARGAALGAHFWAFEIDGEDGRYVEFLEGADDACLAALDTATREVLTLAAGSREDETARVGAAGLRSTEVRPEG